MKSDEDVWISRSTKASRPDELGPDEAAGYLSLGRSWQGREEGGEPAAERDTRRRGRGTAHLGNSGGNGLAECWLCREVV